MDYQYGTGPDQVDSFFRTKRSWSRVKDKIVGDYVDCYLKTVPHLQRPILIVDGFAGPGRFGDDTEGSPLIICNAISRRSKARGAGCLFADAHPGHRNALESNLRAFIESGVAGAPYPECSEALTKALELGTTSTIFFYLDPYGIKDLEFDMVRQIYERNPNRSTEVLINFNFRTFMRMSGNWNYADSADEVSRKVKEAKTETVNAVMGGDYWRAIVLDPKLSKIDRENAVMNAYLERVRRYFKFAYAIPVKERREEDRGIPDDELAHYHLIFGTRSARAVLYMNDVAYNALEPYMRQFREGLLFDFTPERYLAADRAKIKAALVNAVKPKPLKRPDIYELVIPHFFMQYPKKDYRAMIDELAFQEGQLFPNPLTLKIKNKLNDDTLIATLPW